MDMRHDDGPPPRDAAAHALAWLRAWEAQNLAYIEFLNRVSSSLREPSLIWGLSATSANSLRRLAPKELDYRETGELPPPRAAGAEFERRPRSAIARGMVETQLIGGRDGRPGHAASPDPFAALKSLPRDLAELREVGGFEPIEDSAPPKIDRVGEWERWRRGATDPRL